MINSQRDCRRYTPRHDAAATSGCHCPPTEALWAELHERGVDVLGVILALTDTPALRRLLARRGLLTSDEDHTANPGAVSSATGRRGGSPNLANGPAYFVGDMLRDGAQQLAALPRNDAVRLMIELGADTMGRAEEVAG